MNNRKLESLNVFVPWQQMGEIKVVASVTTGKKEYTILSVASHPSFLSKN
jgi:hypothetical protein